MSKEKEFEIGQTVWLVSGGPNMVIFSKNGNIYKTSWYDNFDNYKEAEFISETLTDIEPESKS